MVFMVYLSDGTDGYHPLLMPSGMVSDNDGAGML
jgi:hypothetical protein